MLVVSKILVLQTMWTRYTSSSWNYLPLLFVFFVGLLEMALKSYRKSLNYGWNQVDNVFPKTQKRILGFGPVKTKGLVLGTLVHFIKKFKILSIPRINILSKVEGEVVYYFQFYFSQVLAGVAVSCVCQTSQGTGGPGGLCEPKQ